MAHTESQVPTAAITADEELSAPETLSSWRAGAGTEQHPASDECADGAAPSPDQIDRALAALDAEGRIGASSPLHERLELLACLHHPTPEESTERQVDIPGFRLLRLLGRGGMGVVYEGEELALGRRVAIKVLRHDLALDAGSVQLFHREMRILARLRHPGIAGIFGAAQAADGRPCCVMEMVQGQRLMDALEDRIAPFGSPSPDAEAALGASSRQGISPQGLAQRLELFIQICDAVAYAHRFGVVHRDLKPANILVVEEGEGTSAASGNPSAADAGGAPLRCKILDFGLAKLLDPQLLGGLSTQSLAGVVGTVQYMSPEQVVGDPGLVDTRSDVYSLGVILYEMLLGSPPHGRRGDPAWQVMRAIRDAPPTRPGQVDPALRGDLEAVVLMALAKSPEDRYPGVPELGEDVQRVLRGEPVLARSASRWELRRRWLRRHWRGVAAASSVVLSCIAIAVVMGGLWMSSQRSLHRVEGTNAALREILRAADPERLGKDVTVHRMLDEVIAKADAGQFAGDPLAEAFVRATAGATLFGLGESLKADAQLSLARRIYEARGETDSIEYAECLADLAVAARYTGRPGAPSLMEQSVALHEQLLGPEDLRTAARLHDYAYFLRDLKRHSDAEAVFRRAIDIRRRKAGPESPELALSLNSLSQLLKAVDRMEEAQALAEESRAIFALHPPTVNTAFNLGEVAIHLRREGRIEESFAAEQEGLRIFRDQLVDGDPWIRRAATNLAKELTAHERHEEAVAVWTSLLEMWERVPPKFARERPTVQGALARNLVALGRFEEAAAHGGAAYDELVRLEIWDHAWRAAQTMAKLHDQWHAIDPGGGHKADSQAWWMREKELRGQGMRR